jgi:hypothetical protein
MTFFVGNLVEVEKEHRTGRRDSDGGRAYILAINNDPNGRGTKRPQYDVKYVVGGIICPNVKRRGISPVIMETTARRRLGDIGNGHHCCLLITLQVHQKRNNGNLKQ